jgi:hypothetical protein
MLFAHDSSGRHSESALTSYLNTLQTQVENIEAGSFGWLLRYLEEGHRHYSLALEFAHVGIARKPKKLRWDL